MLLLLTV